MASTVSRVLTNAFYALGETKRPARVAVIRVVVSAAVGAALMVLLDRYPIQALPWPVEESGLRLGGVGLALGSAVGAWLEIALLARELRRARSELVAGLRRDLSLHLRFLGLAIVALAPAAAVAGWTSGLPWAARAGLVIGCYAVLLPGARQAPRCGRAA